MKKSLLGIILLSGSMLFAQRYTSEVFTSVTVTKNIEYGVNIDFLFSDFSNPSLVGQDLTEIKTAVGGGQPIPAKFFNPADQSTKVKVSSLKMDVYAPTGDVATNRPVVVFLHTGNFLPPRVNGGINGSKNDSSAIVLCEKFAKRGFVAVAANYRLGWNPLDPSVQVRRGQLLNAVYRAIHDAKQCVRNLKADAATYGIDPNKVIIYGEGSGGYVALAYATLDKWSEVNIAKFAPGGTSYIDTNRVGNFEGFGGLLNIYGPNGQNSDINFVINAGGALADTSWLEAGDAPMIAFHCVRDPFAPFDEGTVIVPTTGDDVVDVQGANVFMAKANAVGNNASFTSQTYSDPITLKARARYGQTYQYLYPAPFDMITVNTNVEGLFPVLRPFKSSVFQNEGSPWQWWDPNGPIASDTASAGPPVVTYHQLGLSSNPDMSPMKGRTYLDTILNYATPRLFVSLNLLGAKEATKIASYDVFPNPTNDVVNIKTAITNAIERVEVLDLTGKSIKVLTPDNNQVQVHLAELPQGVYLLKTTISGVSETLKITKY